MLINKSISVTYIFGQIKYDIYYVLIVSIMVHLLTKEYQWLLPEMPLTIPAFIGTAISVLLSFKLNQSYDRWWEARKVWGSIVNDSRSLLIQLQSFTAQAGHALIRKIAYRQIAWCYSLGQTLRGLDPLENLDNYLEKEELEELKAHSNKPLALLRLHALDIRQLRENNQLELFSQVQLDDTLTRLCDSQGKAERIKSTVFPVTYRIFLQGIIYLFVITLSVSLKNISVVFEMPLLLLISTAFFLLEKTASHLQDPFNNNPTDTAVTAIARTIEINLKQLLHEQEIPEPCKPVKYYLM